MLSGIAHPEYRQLIMELFCIVATIMERNPVRDWQFKELWHRFMTVRILSFFYLKIGHYWGRVFQEVHIVKSNLPQTFINFTNYDMKIK